MSAIATLKALLTADASGFQAGVNSAKSSVSSFQSSLGSIKGLIAGAFSIGAIVSFGKSVIDWASNLSIAARNTGIATSEMIAFNRVAQTAGLSTDQMARMLAVLQDKLDDAINKGGDSAAAFQNLGLSLSDLARMNPSEMMLAVAKASVQAGASVSDLADLFGMKLGPAARAALQGIADGLPEIDKSLGETADKVERMASKWITVLDRVKGPTAEFFGWLGEKFATAQDYWSGITSEWVDNMDNDTRLLAVLGVKVGGKNLLNEAGLKGVKQYQDEDEEAQAKRDKLAQDQQRAAEEERLRKIEEARVKELFDAQQRDRAEQDINDKLVESKLEGIKKINAESIRSEKEVIAQMQGAEPEIKKILQRRLEIIRQQHAQEVADFKSSEREKAQSAYGKASDEVNSLIASRNKERDSARGRGIDADSMARMGGMVGGFRPGLAQIDRQIQMQRAGNDHLAAIRTATEALARARKSLSGAGDDLSKD